MTHQETLLCDVFGFSKFRPGKKEIVDAVACGDNVLPIMPTGGGKSLSFQLPALLRDGVTVVFSPLIALMRDQVRALQASGVAAGALISANTQQETDTVFDALSAGKLKLLYLAPERLAADFIQSVLRRYQASMLAVDDPHCVSQWGHDFRPDYLRIGPLWRALGVPLAAFTATADAETQREIIEKDCSTAQRLQHSCVALMDRTSIYPLPPKILPESSFSPLLRRQKGNQELRIAAPVPKSKRLPLRCPKRGILPAIITAGWKRICGAKLKPALPLRMG